MNSKECGYNLASFYKSTNKEGIKKVSHENFKGNGYEFIE